MRATAPASPSAAADGAAAPPHAACPAFHTVAKCLTLRAVADVMVAMCMVFRVCRVQRRLPSAIPGSPAAAPLAQGVRRVGGRRGRLTSCGGARAATGQAHAASGAGAGHEGGQAPAPQRALYWGHLAQEGGGSHTTVAERGGSSQAATAPQAAAALIELSASQGTDAHARGRGGARAQQGAVHRDDPTAAPGERQQRVAQAARWQACTRAPQPRRAPVADPAGCKRNKRSVYHAVAAGGPPGGD